MFEEDELSFAFHFGMLSGVELGFQYGIKVGWLLGKQFGHYEDSQQVKYSIAKQMLLLNIPVTIVARVTELSEKMIEAIKRDVRRYH